MRLPGLKVLILFFSFLLVTPLFSCRNFDIVERSEALRLPTIEEGGELLLEIFGEMFEEMITKWETYRVTPEQLMTELRVDGATNVKRSGNTVIATVEPGEGSDSIQLITIGSDESSWGIVTRSESKDGKNLVFEKSMAYLIRFQILELIGAKISVVICIETKLPSSVKTGRDFHVHMDNKVRHASSLSDSTKFNEM